MADGDQKPFLITWFNPHSSMEKKLHPYMCEMKLLIYFQAFGLETDK